MYLCECNNHVVCIGVCCSNRILLFPQENVTDSRDLRFAFWDFTLNG